jgi:cytochrome c oxidase subunit IV
MSANATQEHNSQDYIPETYIPEPELHGTKELWKVFWLLLVITVVDFIIYFAMGASMVRNVIFIVLGLVKAFFIVGTFMHLKYERMFMILMIVLPALAFIGMLVFGLLHEGNALSK